MLPPSQTPISDSIKSSPMSNAIPQAILDRTKNWNIMVGSLTLLLVGSFVTVLWWLVHYPVPIENKDTVFFMAGQLSVFTGIAVGYWMQSTAQSKAKTELLANGKQSAPHG